MTEQPERLRREDLHGSWMMEQEAELPDSRARERLEISKAFGLEPSESIRDRNLTLFNRMGWGYSTHTPFIGLPYLEDMRQLGGQDIAIVGVPFDGGTVVGPGPRLGPQAIRQVSAYHRGYLPELGVDLIEQLDIVDVGDVTVIPGNLEKSFDQIAMALSYLAEREVMPVVLGGDHSIGYPDVRGLAPYFDGNIGIIHFDRHSDYGEFTLDERAHGSPFYHATNIPNAPPANLVQIGIGGPLGSRPAMRNARERESTVVAMRDLDRWGVDKVIELALEVAWKNATGVWISFDVDSIDAGSAPGTPFPVPGGISTRELLAMVRGIAREGIVGMEVVEVSPLHDINNVTSLLAMYAVMECIGTLIEAGKVRTRSTNPTRAAADAPGTETRTLPGTLQRGEHGDALASGWCLVSYPRAGFRAPLDEWHGEMICADAASRAAIAAAGANLYLRLEPYAAVVDRWHGPVRVEALDPQSDPTARRLRLVSAGALVRS